MLTTKRTLSLAAASLLVLGLVAGCASDTKKEETEYTGEDLGDDRGSRGLDESRLNERGLRGVEDDEKSMFLDPNNPLSTRIIYFEYDSDVVKSEFMASLKAHAAYAGQKGKTIRLEGHADERGTREYNVGLSERRAQAVQKVLSLEGMSADALPTLAFGEERPADLGHDEGAWAQNRRVELIYVQ